MKSSLGEIIPHSVDAVPAYCCIIRHDNPQTANPRKEKFLDNS